MDYLEYRKKSRDKGMTRMGRMTLPVLLLFLSVWTLAALAEVVEVYIYQTHAENLFSDSFRIFYLVCTGLLLFCVKLAPKIAIPKTSKHIAEIRNNATWQAIGISLTILAATGQYSVLWFLKPEPVAVYVIAGCYLVFWASVAFTQALTRNYLRLLQKHGLWEPDEATVLWLGGRKRA